MCLLLETESLAPILCFSIIKPENVHESTLRVRNTVQDCFSAMIIVWMEMRRTQESGVTDLQEPPFISLSRWNHISHPYLQPASMQMHSDASIRKAGHHQDINCLFKKQVQGGEHTV